MYISIHAPRAGRDCEGCKHRIYKYVFQSTRPVRGATPLGGGAYERVCISIHAPRAGRDTPPPKTKEEKPCTFQSTRPVRGATLQNRLDTGKAIFQSTRPVRGATPGSTA